MTRKIVSALAAVVALAAAATIGWRVLRPSEVAETATRPVPVAETTRAGVVGNLLMAPLIVAESVRVYAGERYVKADGPVDAGEMHTPLWSLRRWPQRLNGLAAGGTTVISRWGDGVLVAVDGRTGKEIWRADGPAPAATDGRTGADAALAPPGLHISGGTVLATDGTTLLARSAADGRQLWRVTLPAGCGDGFVTAGGSYVCGVGAWDVSTGRARTSWPVGPSTALGCDVARSGCAGLRDSAGQGWLTGAEGPVRTPALDSAAATAGDGLVLAASAGTITASGAASWSWEGEGDVLGVRGGKVALLTADRYLVVLDARTGTVRSRFPLYADEREEAWKPHLWQLTEHWLAIERLKPAATGDPHESNHYYSMNPVILAAV